MSIIIVLFSNKLFVFQNVCITILNAKRLVICLAKQGVLFDMLIRERGQRPFKIWREISIPRATRPARVI